MRPKPACHSLPSQIPNFFAERPYLFCLPVPATLPTLPDKIASEVSFLLKQAGVIQYSVKATRNNGTGTVPYKAIFIWNERAVEGEDYFRYLLYSFARILHLPFMLQKARDGRIYRISTDQSSGIPVGKIESVAAGSDEYEFTTRILAKALGGKWMLEEVAAIIHSFEGMNGAMMRDMIYRGCLRYGEAFLYNQLELEPDWDVINAYPYLYEKQEEPTINVLKDGRDGDWPDSTSGFFPGSNPVYLLTAFRDDRTIIDNIRRNEQLLSGLTEAGCFCLYGKWQKDTQDDRICILAQNVFSTRHDSFFKRLLELYQKDLMLPEPAVVLAKEDLQKFKAKGGRFPTAGLEGAARRDRLGRVIISDQDSLPDIIRNIARRNAKEASEAAENEAPEDTPMHAVIAALTSPTDVFCLKVSDSIWPDDKTKKLRQLEMCIGDIGCSGFIVSATGEYEDKAAEFIFAIPQNNADNTAIQFLTSCARACGESRFLYKADDGNLFVLESTPDCKAMLLSQPMPETPEEVATIIDKVFGAGIKIAEDSEIRKFSETKGFSAIDRRARAVQAMNEYGLNGVAKLLGEKVEPLPFKVTPLVNTTQEDSGSKTPDGPYFTVKGRPVRL